MRTQTVHGYDVVRFVRLAREHNRREYAKWAWYAVDVLAAVVVWYGLYLLVCRLAGWK